MGKSCGQPTVHNILIPLKNAETLIEVTAPVKKIMLQVREFKEIRIAFIPNESGTNYFTVKSGCTYYEDNVQGPFIMAVQAIEDNTTIEYVAWYHWD